MRQLNLFSSPKEPEARRPPDLAFVRKNLSFRLRTAQRAIRLPWSEADTKTWEKLFPELADLLPPDEAETYKSAFAIELARLKAVAA